MMIERILFFTFLVALFRLANTQQSCDPGLDCLLKSLTIPLDNYTYTQDSSTLSIDQIFCNNALVPSYTSSLPSFLNVQVATDTASLTCVGNWKYTSENGTNNGNLDVLVNGISLTIDVVLIQNASYQLVGGVDTSCEIAVPVLSVVLNNQSIPASIQDDLNKFLNDQIGSATCSKIVDITYNSFNNTFNTSSTWAISTIQNNNYGPPNPDYDPIPPTEGMVKYQNNPFLGLVDYVVNDVLGPTGPLSINTLVNIFTNNTGAFNLNWGNNSQIQYFPLLASQTFDFGNFATLTLKPLWLNITGLNDWGFIDFAKPVYNQTLDTTTMLNNLGLNVEFNVNITFTDPASQGGSIAQNVVLNTNLAQSELFTEAVFAINSTYISSLATSQLLAPQCYIPAISFIWLNYLNLSFNMQNSGVGPAPNQEITQVGTLMNDLLSTFVQSVSPSVDQIITGALWPPYGIGLPIVNYEFPGLINSSMYKYPCPNPKIPNATFNKLATIYASAAAVGVFLLLVLVSYLILRFHDAETTPLLKEYKHTALIYNPGLPVLVRYGVVLALLGIVAMFIASNASLGASVYLVVRTADSSTMFPSLFDFSLVNSVKDMWNAKVYALSVLIALFSGVWPYTKLLLLLICWCTPPRILNLQRRGRVLIMLDAMGKWSLIDSFVLILMMVAFHFSLAPPPSPYLPAGALAFVAYVEPHFGFYSFLLATMLSLVVTHLVIKLHDITLLELDAEEYIDDSKEALWAHAAGSSSPYRAAYVLTAVTVLLVTASVLLGFGIHGQSFDFTFRGAFGVLLRFLDQPDNLSFSVVSLGTAFAGSSLSPDSVGTRFIQASFFIFAIAMPCLYLLCLLVLWMVPLTYHFQSRLLTLTATIHAWSALEVFVISIIAALLELQQFAQFIVGNRCDMINKILRTYGNELLHGDDKCFDVVATLKTGCWVLFAACVIYVIVGSLVVKGCHNALKGRLSRPHSYVN